MQATSTRSVRRRASIAVVLAAASTGALLGAGSVAQAQVAPSSTTSTTSAPGTTTSTPGPTTSTSSPTTTSTVGTTTTTALPTTTTTTPTGEAAHPFPERFDRPRPAGATLTVDDVTHPDSSLHVSGTGCLIDGAPGWIVTRLTGPGYRSGGWAGAFPDGSWLAGFLMPDDLPLGTYELRVGCVDDSGSGFEYEPRTVVARAWVGGAPVPATPAPATPRFTG